MKAEEGYIDVPGGKVWYRAVGDDAEATPLLCLHGGPASPTTTSSRSKPWRTGAGSSSTTSSAAGARIGRATSCGTWTGSSRSSRRSVRPSISTACTCSAAPGAAGFTGCPEYQAAILGFYRKHVCRLDPWPPGLERSFAEAGYDVYNTMNGPSEFTVTGTLKNWDIMDRLPEIGVRTLLVGGRYDECTPSHLEEMHRRIAGSQLVIIEDASHLCFAEQPEEFNTVINSFMT